MKSVTNTGANYNINDNGSDEFEIAIVRTDIVTGE